MSRPATATARSAKRRSTDSRPAEVGSQKVSALRFAERRTLALLGALTLFYLHTIDFRNADLKLRIARLLVPVDALSPGRMSYELRRLRLRGLVERVRTATATA